MALKKKKSLHHILFPNQFFKPKSSFLLGFVLKILVHLFKFLQILSSNACFMINHWERKGFCFLDRINMLAILWTEINPGRSQVFEIQSRNWTIVSSHLQQCSLLLPGTQLDWRNLLMSWETVETQIIVTLPFHRYENEQNLVPNLLIVSTTEQLVFLSRKLWTLATESLRSCSPCSLKKSLWNRTVTVSLWTFTPPSAL